MEEDILDKREQRRLELESTFSYDGYQVVRKELFAHLREPAITIRNDSITFNSACINQLEDTIYVHIMFNKELKRIVVTPCDKNDKDALRWCVAKPDKRKPRKMTCKPFAKLVYEQLGWNTNQRYKMLGYPIEYQGKKFFVFDLLVHEIFEEKSKDTQDTDTPVNTRKGYYSEDVSNTFGLPVVDHINETTPTKLDGYVSIGLLTGQNNNSSINKKE